MVSALYITSYNLGCRQSERQYHPGLVVFDPICVVLIQAPISDDDNAGRRNLLFHPTFPRPYHVTITDSLDNEATILSSCSFHTYIPFPEGNAAASADAVGGGEPPTSHQRIHKLRTSFI
ncbi:hypothetical protein PG993_000261 [Apiospora rasikravindrae]|uniref:Uncharacterized protein n=1 Tax=Apiospora rasikravindrae TaxID=990691 RepID=A0ABR1U819_9PEZI